MAKVNLDINGRKYALGCEDGEEERLLFLGNKLNERIDTLARQFGQIGDLRLLVMASITLTDELEEMRSSVRERTSDLEARIKKDAQVRVSDAEKTEESASDALVDAAKRIEELAARLQKTS